MKFFMVAPLLIFAFISSTSIAQSTEKDIADKDDTCTKTDCDTKDLYTDNNVYGQTANECQKGVDANWDACNAGIKDPIPKDLAAASWLDAEDEKDAGPSDQGDDE